MNKQTKPKSLRKKAINKVKPMKAYAVYIFDEPTSLHLFRKEAQEKVNWAKQMPSLKKLTNTRIVPVLITPISQNGEKKKSNDKK